MTESRILLVDDHRAFLDSLTGSLEKLGAEIGCAQSAGAALQLMGENDYAVVVTDLSMPDIGGIELLAAIKGRSPETEVIISTAYPDVESAMQALKLGAHDYPVKGSAGPEEVAFAIAEALDKQRLRREGEQMLRELTALNAIATRLRELVERLGQNHTQVRGESGSASEVK